MLIRQLEDEMRRRKGSVGQAGENGMGGLVGNPRNGSPKTGEEAAWWVYDLHNLVNK